jgi:hypothetical protein
VLNAHKFDIGGMAFALAHRQTVGQLPPSISGQHRPEGAAIDTMAPFTDLGGRPFAGKSPGASDARLLGQRWTRLPFSDA